MQSSIELFQKAKRIIPGGVNSPVRAFGSVGGTPIFIEHGEGAYLYDTEGNRYIDYVGSWGPLITGHSHPHIIQAVQKQAEKGLSFGAPTEFETTLAEKIQSHLPSMEMMRFVNSGTEATMSAIRLARAATQRDKIIKFAGCYHGHSDSLLVNAGSGALTCGVPSSPGVPDDIAKHTLVCEYNDIDGVENLFKENPGQIACIIVEPIPGNMGFIKPREGYLQGLKSLCQEHEALLIFDEVMTGFRVGLKGVQGHYGITPDLTTLGKVIGAGMPVGAFGGRRDLMELMAPVGPVYQAGTLSGNPIAMAAGIAHFDLIEAPGFFEDLSRKTALLVQGLAELAGKHRVPLKQDSLGGMFGFFFSDDDVYGLEDVKKTRLESYKRFFHEMLERGVYLAPSPFEAGFVSSAHSDKDISDTLNLAETVLQRL